MFQTIDFLRIAYLFIISSVMPAAFFYLRQVDSGYLRALPVTLWISIFPGGLFRGIFVIMSGMRYFPTYVRGAVISVVLMVVDAWAAAGLGEFDALFGAFSLMVSITTGLCLYFLLMCVFFLIPKLKKRFFYYDMPGYFVLPAAALVLMLLILRIFLPPLMNELNSEENLWYRIFYGLMFSADAFLVSRTFFVNNMFAFEKDGRHEERNKTLEKWSLVTVLCLIFSIIITAFVVFVPA